MLPFVGLFFASVRRAKQCASFPSGMPNIAIKINTRSFIPASNLSLQGNDGLTESKGQAACTAIKYTAVCLFASGLVLGICFFFVRTLRRIASHNLRHFILLSLPYVRILYP